MEPTLVSAIMSKQLLTVPESMPVAELICVLVDRNVGGAPVIDRDGRAVGMVSKSDLVWEDHDWAESMRSLADWRKIAGGKAARDDGLVSERNFATLTVRDVMTRGALSVLPTATVEDAARLMMSNRVHRLSVIDAGEKLVGVITTYDITRWVAERRP